MSGMRRNELDDCCLMVRGGDAAVGCSLWGLVPWEAKTTVVIYCGNHV